MRRAAIQALRTARRTHVRRVLNSRGSLLSSSNHVALFRSTSPISKPDQSLQVLHSSLLFRNFSLALVSTLLASGAWFAYRGQSSSEKGALSDGNIPTNTSPILASLPSTNVYTTSPQHSVDSASTEEFAEQTRRALVVENDQFYTGDIYGNEPLSKDTDTSGRMVLEMLTPEQATQKLRQHEESYLVGRGQGVVRYDLVQLASNNPIEDDHSEKIIEVPESNPVSREGSPSSDWMFWGVFDGHSGWTTSAKLRQVLIQFVAKELKSVYKPTSDNTSLHFPSPQSIDAAIKQGFLRLDNEICNESVEKVVKMGTKRLAAEQLAPALSGSCALLSFYDSKSKLLRVACTGDSRAVLGTRGASGKWIATALSEDQTGGTPSEMARLRQEHPGEEFVTKNGRILGQLEPSRAFGDAVYKWSKETSQRMKTTFFGKSPSPLLKTPPYVTAEPIITTTKVHPEKGDFLVMATDGLWECLTNEEVIGLVGQWLDSQASRTSSSDSDMGGIWMKSWFGHKDNSLPVEKDGLPGKKEKKGDGQRVPLRQDQWQINGGDERFVVEDKNAATHLVRNALGGKDRDMVCALLTLPSPYSRRYRDDLTVEVIFFGEGDRGGKVVANTEASASSGLLKAKL